MISDCEQTSLELRGPTKFELANRAAEELLAAMCLPEMLSPTNREDAFDAAITFLLIKSLDR